LFHSAPQVSGIVGFSESIIGNQLAALHCLKKRIVKFACDARAFRKRSSNRTLMALATCADAQLVREPKSRRDQQQCKAEQTSSSDRRPAIW
jgi:hypothetical protein